VRSRHSARSHLRTDPSYSASVATTRLLVRDRGLSSTSLLPPFDEEAFPRDVKPRERRSSRRLRVAFVIAVLYFAVIALAPFPDRLVLFPTTDRIDAGGAIRKPIPFDGGELEIWTAASKLAQQRGQSRIYVLRFYGNADRADRWVAAEAEMWNNRAVEI
jgi:hypothetical protein